MFFLPGRFSKLSQILSFTIVKTEKKVQSISFENVNVDVIGQNRIQ